MMKRMILTALAAVAIPTWLMAADEARLMRFPATNGSEIVFSYAGDLYKVPATGGEAQRLTSYVGYEMFPRSVSYTHLDVYKRQVFSFSDL